MDSSLLSWTAGIVDGEANVDLLLNKSKTSINPSFTPKVKIDMTHFATVRRVRQILGIGAVSDPRTSNNVNGSDYITWFVSSDDAIYVCKLLLPFLFTKKRQAEILLAYWDIPRLKGGKPQSDETIIKFHILHDEIRELNKRGKHHVK
jgi:hypothetical protein